MVCMMHTSPRSTASLHRPFPKPLLNTNLVIDANRLGDRVHGRRRTRLCACWAVRHLCLDLVRGRRATFGAWIITVVPRVHRRNIRRTAALPLKGDIFKAGWCYASGARGRRRCDRRTRRRVVDVARGCAALGACCIGARVGDGFGRNVGWAGGRVADYGYVQTFLQRTVGAEIRRRRDGRAGGLVVTGQAQRRSASRSIIRVERICIDREARAYKTKTENAIAAKRTMLDLYTGLSAMRLKRVGNGHFAKWSKRSKDLTMLLGYVISSESKTLP